MEGVEFTRDEKEEIAGRVQLYFREELEQEIGRFDAEFLVDFFAEELGVYFYNRGLYDAQALISKNAETLVDALYELEQPTNTRK